MDKLKLNPNDVEVASFPITERMQENGTARAWGWSDDSVCPTTTPSENRSCY